jgi:hypothetical protein
MPCIHLAAAEIDVSDHAVLRWVERVCGVDVERFREEIRAALVAGAFPHIDLQPGDAGVFIDVPVHRVPLLARHGEVITVFNYDRDPD